MLIGLALKEGKTRPLCFSMLADPNNTILVGAYVCSRSHGCGKGQQAGKGKYIWGSVFGVKCHDLLGAYRTSKPHVAQIIKGRCVPTHISSSLVSASRLPQLVCLKRSPKAALKRIRATEHMTSAIN